jgi:acyl carrier protein
MEEKFNSVLAAAFDKDLSEVNDQMSSDTIAEWDSLKQMNIIVALEEEFDIYFEEDESILLKDYRGLFNAVKSKLEKKN